MRLQTENALRRNPLQTMYATIELDDASKAQKINLEQNLG